LKVLVGYPCRMLSKFHVGRVIQALVREHLQKPRRSPQWRAVRKKHLVENPRCAACGGKTFKQVHHILPYADRPDLELEPSNLITLCMGKLECHLHIGHGGNYQYFSASVVRDSRVVALYPYRRRDIELSAKEHRRNRP